MSLMMPRKMKHRKQQRGNMNGIAVRGSYLTFGKYGIKTLEPGLISARQIEAARRAMTRYIRRGGQIWIRIFPDKPITTKPLEVGMGKGKGSVDHFSAVVLPGKIMFEMDGVAREVAMEALRLASHKISVKTKFVEKIVHGE